MEDDGLEGRYLHAEGDVENHDKEVVLFGCQQTGILRNVAWNLPGSRADRGPCPNRPSSHCRPGGCGVAPMYADGVRGGRVIAIAA